jgi:hypothetical protein
LLNKGNTREKLRTILKIGKISMQKYIRTKKINLKKIGGRFVYEDEELRRLFTEGLPKLTDL